MIARLPTVIAITTTEDEDIDLIPPRISSRLNDMRQGVIYGIRAPDYRTGRAYASKPPASASRRRPSNPRGS